MKEILLTQGKVALVDDERYEELSWYKWHFSDGYAKRTMYRDGKKCQWRMQWSVVGKPTSGLVADHVNRNRLDNRIENLRICTRLENSKNRGVDNRNSSGYKGVYKQVNMIRGKRYEYWRVQISSDGKVTTKGSFKTAREAAKAYNKLARRLHGEFASINNI